MAGAAGVGRCGGGGRYGDAMVVVGEDAMIEINGMEEEDRKCNYRFKQVIVIILVRTPSPPPQWITPAPPPSATPFVCL